MELTDLRNQQPTSRRVVLVASVAWWIIPILVRLQSPRDLPLAGVAFACLIGLAIALAVCAKFRQARWVVLIWVPLLFWTGSGALWTFAAVASEPHGGPNAAPLEGVATLLGLAAGLILSVCAILSLVWRPLVFSVPLVILAVANTTAVSFLAPLANRQATRQDIILHLLDSHGGPLSAASVRFTRYGYGSGGRNVFDADGGPLLSGEDGTVIIPSRRMRYETRGTISKAGFRDVFFTVGMQYSEWDRDRGVTVSTVETPNIARGSISSAEPVTLFIYLQSMADAPDAAKPLRQLSAKSDIGRGPNAKRFLDLQTGKFGSDQNADLQFEMLVEKDGRYGESGVRITGLNGTRLLQVPYLSSLSGVISSYENVYRIAPISGYLEQIDLETRSIPGPIVYISARGGEFFGRMSVEAWSRNSRVDAPCEVSLFINLTGGRSLEYVK